MTAKEYQDLPKRLSPRRITDPAKSKYKNVRSTQDGISFDSKAELKRYNTLRVRVLAGEITELRVHPSYELESAFRDVRDKHHRAESYVADFEYVEGGKIIVEDVKGGKATQTALFKSKSKRFIRRYPNHELRIVT